MSSLANREKQISSYGQMCIGYSCLLMFVIAFGPLYGNNLKLTNLQFEGDNVLSIDISWDNAWSLEDMQEPSNHDAIWIFVKIRKAGEEWLHANISTIHSLDPQLQVIVSSDRKGAFVSLAERGSRNVPLSKLEIVLTDLEEDSYDFKVFGIEMVYIPDGPFFVGDERSFYHLLDAKDSTAFWIDSEASISKEALGSKELYPPYAEVPAAYPKGFGAMYIMKYEISQAQYRDFLNCLGFEQQKERTIARPDAMPGTFVMSVSQLQNRRNGIVILESGIMGQKPAVYACNAQEDEIVNYIDDGQYRACNQLNWEDLMAYLDWAALRPISELEFEKAARGSEIAIPGGFAWGTDEVIDANTIIHDGTEQEAVAERAVGNAGLASHGYLGPDGPLRGGFGGSDSSSRLQIGGSYYGVLELSGNLWELVVNLDSLGLQFKGAHGDGVLDVNGRANVQGWPRGKGAGHRGGALNSGIIGPYRDLAISDRFYIELYPDQRRNTTGGRGGRGM